MSTSTAWKLFGAMYVVIFFAAMWLVSGGVMDWAAISSVPIVLCSDAIVLSMLYFAIFHGELHEQKLPSMKKATLLEKDRARAA